MEKQTLKNIVFSTTVATFISTGVAFDGLRKLYDMQERPDEYSQRVKKAAETETYFGTAGTLIFGLSSPLIAYFGRGNLRQFPQVRREKDYIAPSLTNPNRFSRN